MLFPDESFFNVHDGMLGALAFNDEAPMAAWSHYHADALAARLTEYRNRLSAAEWRVADTSARLDAYAGASDAVRLRLQQCVSVATADRDAIRQRLSVLVGRAHVMDAAREADPYAPRVSAFDLSVEHELAPTAEG